MGAQIISGGGQGSLGVSSLNGETGAVTIVAGTGITVTPSGNNITIAATGSGGAGTAGQIAFYSSTGTVSVGDPRLTDSGTILAYTGTGGIQTPAITVPEITYGPFVLLSASGAIPPHAAQRYIITLASAAALTLAAPTAGTDDGKTLTVQSNTAFAHTITATGLFHSGVSAAVNLATFAAFAGATIVLMAYNGFWNVVSLNGVTMS